MFTVDFDFSKINAALDRIAKAAEKATRPAAQAGSEVFYREVRARVASKNFKTGKLHDAIYQAFVEKESSDSHATYRISWNKKEAFYGRFLEEGTSKMAARPFLRPAYDAVQGRAVKAVTDRMHAEVRKAIQ